MKERNHFIYSIGIMMGNGTILFFAIPEKNIGAIIFGSIGFLLGFIALIVILTINLVEKK